MICCEYLMYLHTEMVDVFLGGAPRRKITAKAAVLPHPLLYVTNMADRVHVHPRHVHIVRLQLSGYLLPVPTNGDPCAPAPRPFEDPDEDVSEVTEDVERGRQPHHVVILVNDIIHVETPDDAGLRFYLVEGMAE